MLVAFHVHSHRADHGVVAEVEPVDVDDQQLQIVEPKWPASENRKPFAAESLLLCSSPPTFVVIKANSPDPYCSACDSSPQSFKREAAPDYICHASSIILRRETMGSSAIAFRICAYAKSCIAGHRGRH